MTYALGADLFDHLQRLSLRFHSKALTGDLVRRVTTDSNCVRELMFAVFIPALTAVITLIAVFTGDVATGSASGVSGFFGSYPYGPADPAVGASNDGAQLPAV